MHVSARWIKVHAILILLAVSLSSAPGSAEIPRMISYQGKVTDNGGAPVTDGSYTMRFRIYNALTSGTLRWDSGNRSVAVSAGIFNVLLGESPQPPLNLNFDEDYWLLVTFEGTSQSPRQRLSSSGYAYMASGLAPGTSVAGGVASAPVIKADNTYTLGFADGIWGITHSTAGWGVYGWAATTTGQTYGVSGYNSSGSTGAAGVHGEAGATAGTIYGGRFITKSTSGRGCYGWASATTGTTYGGLFRSSSTSGYGVWGKAEASSGTTYGGWFANSSAGSGVGVCGKVTNVACTGYGVWSLW